MRSQPREDFYEGNDFLDPFWVLFAEEDDSVEAPSGTRKTMRRKPPCYDHHEGGDSVLNYFIPEDYLEEREPADLKRAQKEGRQKKQHYWRRNNMKRDKDQKTGFGRKGNPKRNSGVSSSAWAANRNSLLIRDTPGGNIRNIASITDEATSIDCDNKPAPFPNLMDALTNNWDPWGDRSSSCDSSAGTYLSYESSRNEESTNSATVSYASTSVEGAKEQQEVQQVLVQFNPLSTARSQQREITVQHSKPTCLKDSPLKEAEETLKARSSSREITASGFDESTLSSHEHLEHDDGSRLKYDVPDDEGDPSSCLGSQCSSLNNVKITKLFRRKVPKDELERHDLATIFPKLRMVADDKDVRSPAVVASGKVFNGNVPAHLQLSSEAFMTTKGPQSVYEYEYDGGEHIDVAYNHFGPNPISLLMIRHHVNPPRPRFKGAVVQVEASTISVTDCSMRCGEWMGKDTPPLPITPGVDMVGKIFRIDQDNSSLCNLSVGDRVISLTRCGGNSRYLSIDPNRLVKISENVDPAEAACLAETYMSAFQVLHFGQSQVQRYRSNALKGKSILIMGTVVTTLGHAIVELATAAGVEKILATATPKHFSHLRSLGIIPVSIDPALWYDELNGEIDLVLVSNANEEVVAEHFKALNERGQLIVIGQRLGSGMPIGDWERKGYLSARSLVCKRNKARVSMIDRTHDYNPFRQWDQELGKSKKDLCHLVKLLEQRAIKPNVLDRIPLNQVAKAQEMVESQRHPSGFLVCEPWLRNKKRAVRL